MADSWIVGQTVVMDDSELLVVYYGSWMVRRADEAVFSLESFDQVGGKFVMKMFTKNSEDADSAAVVVGSTTSISGVGVHSLKASGLKEMVRYELHGDSISTGRLHFQLMSPQWANN